MKPTEDQIVATVQGVLADMTRDWSFTADIEPATLLIAELGFTSMDVIDLFATLDLKFQRKLPYEQFVTTESGGYKLEMSVTEISRFIHESSECGLASCCATCTD